MSTMCHASLPPPAMGNGIFLHKPIPVIPATLLNLGIPIQKLYSKDVGDMVWPTRNFPIQTEPLDLSVKKRKLALDTAEPLDLRKKSKSGVNGE